MVDPFARLERSYTMLEHCASRLELSLQGHPR